MPWKAEKMTRYFNCSVIDSQMRYEVMREIVGINDIERLYSTDGRNGYAVKIRNGSLKKIL